MKETNHIQRSACCSPAAGTIGKKEQKPSRQNFSAENKADILKPSLITSFIQPKLTIGSPDDPFEREADAMADKVMRMPEPFIQRKCAACEHEEKDIHRKPLASGISPFIQRKATESGVAGDGISSRIEATKGGGHPIPGNTRGFMENRFGTDFSDVRVHTGDYAVQLSRELGAKAFTFGNQIYFNEGQYHPESKSGKQLLAHELTHTVQQGGTINKKIQRTCTPKEIVGLNTVMHSFCDLPRSCNLQTDTCPSAIAKIAAGNGCISLRTIIQQRCFKKGDKGYQSHMKQIAQAYAALRNCYVVETAKCNDPGTPPAPAPEPAPAPAPAPEPAPESNFDKIRRFAKNVVDNGLDAEQAAEEFLRQNPGLAWTIVGLGVVGIIALVADDVTIAGIADDVLVPVLAVLVRVAWRFAL